ncbi:MAG: hypothetical protein V1869_00040 [Candidatus Omnitrophota bacterium]
MRIIICALLFFICGYFNLLQAEELVLPLPSDAVKTMDKDVDAGLTRTRIQVYMTALSGNDIIAMYKKKLLREGWAEQSSGVYLKDGYMVIVAVNPRIRRRDNKTRFSVTTTKIPTKEDILASGKETPDKLGFMPVYPGAKQDFLLDRPTGASAAYETTKSIDDVIFFFKSAMLNYGWSLSGEDPVTANTADCPECRKALAKKIAGEEIKVASSKASLTFRKTNGEICIIRLYQGVFGMSEAMVKKLALEGQALDQFSSKTTILVTYNGNKKNNQ